MNQSDGTVNISIQNPSTTNNTEIYSQFKEYIIINNIALQEETKDLRGEVSKLLNDLNTKEEECDKYDTTTRYLRSLVNNLNELKNNYKFISKTRKDLVNEVIQIKKNNLNNLIKISSTLFSSVILLFILEIIFIRNNIFSQYINLSLYIVTIIPILYKIKVTTKEFLPYFKNKIPLSSQYTQLNEIIKDQEKKTEKLDEETLSLENWIYEV
tara:strand:+ start:740 stop:1375 length:636 start_codon:yes stop_codon:yes gene_type:complete